MTASSELAVETVGLVKRFPKQPDWRSLLRRGGDRLALDHVDLTVQRGETFGLLGPNGAGKTTLVKILCTLITPTSGTARVAGLDVVKHEQQVRRRIGLIYGDERSFFWRLSLEENLRFYAAIYGVPPAIAARRINELIDLVGLGHAARTRMHFFSSGMKQRAAIARGLLSDPEIVFLDEPTTAVDPVATHEIRTMIRERVVAGGRRTAILTTNVMAEAEALCDRIALLNHGRIEMVGDVNSLRRRFQPDETYALRVSDMDEGWLDELRRIPGVHELAMERLDGDALELTVAVRPGCDAIPEVIRRLVEHSARVWSCTRRDLSLDEMFRLTFSSGAAAGRPSLNAEHVAVGSR